MSALAAALAAHNKSQRTDPSTSTPLPPSRPSSPVHQEHPQPVPPVPAPEQPQPLQISTDVSRPNEHLAVLLPKHLWKPDASSSNCDNFYCSVPFSIFERRHHCRKCGGVFCGACTSRTTPLLDIAHLDFLQPPRNVALSSFASPTSPLEPARVCDDCWDQVHGYPTTPRTPDIPRPSLKRALSHPVTLLRSLSGTPSPMASGESSVASSVVGTPPDASTTLLPPSISRKVHGVPSLTSLRTHSSMRSNPTRRKTLRTAHLPLPQDLERSYGELDAYPLRRSSIICKATGGGRWEPKPAVVMAGYRPPIPGAKADFEIQMEREEQEEKRRRENPIIRDGIFQYRFMRDQPPTVTHTHRPIHFSTF